MLVKDQLRIRMEELGVSVRELSERIEVSDQTVRHWLSGRSFPGKSKAPALERALSFKLDYSEGSMPADATVESTMQKTDVETFLAISRLPPEIKMIFGKLAEAIVRLGDNYAQIEDLAGVRGNGHSGHRHSVRRRP
jgi:transcriptional regulator with XRE-family HTH domain